MVCYPMNWTVCFDTPTGWVDFIRSKKRLWGYLKLYLLQYPESWGVSVYLNLRLWKISTPWWWTLRVSRCTPTCNRDSNWVEATVETGLPWDWASHVTAGSLNLQLRGLRSVQELDPTPTLHTLSHTQTTGDLLVAWTILVEDVKSWSNIHISWSKVMHFAFPSRLQNGASNSQNLHSEHETRQWYNFFHHFRILVAKFSTLFAAEAMSASFHVMVPLLAMGTKRGSWQHPYTFPTRWYCSCSYSLGSPLGSYIIFGWRSLEWTYPVLWCFDALI